MKRNGSKATYNRLIKIFEQAGYKSYADLVRRIIDLSDKDSSGSGEEQCQPNTYPQYTQQQALSQLPQAIPESTETYMVVDEENLPEGMSYCFLINMGSLVCNMDSVLCLSFLKD
jgi:hypothetical protein